VYICIVSHYKGGIKRKKFMWGYRKFRSTLIRVKHSIWHGLKWLRNIKIWLCSSCL